MAPSFTVYDFIVDIISGSFALLLVLSILPTNHPAIEWFAVIGLLEGVLFLFVAYVIGHLVQAVASPIDSRWMKTEFSFWKVDKRDRLYPFENILNNQHSSPYSTVIEKFNSSKDDFFGDDLTGAELFSVTQSYLWNHNIGRMRRFQILYTLFRGLWLLFLFGTILYIIILATEVGGWYSVVWSVQEITIICVGLGVSTLLAYHRRKKYHEQMAKSMIIDFYTNVLHTDE